MTAPPDFFLPHQPTQFAEVWNAETCVFIFWPEAASANFLQEHGDILPNENAYPMGTFPSGDPVCIDAETVWIVLHDSLEVIESRVEARDFLNRVTAADVTLEDEAYGS